MQRWWLIVADILSLSGSGDRYSEEMGKIDV